MHERYGDDDAHILAISDTTSRRSDITRYHWLETEVKADIRKGNTSADNANDY